MTEDLISCSIKSLEDTNLYEVLKQKNRQLLVKPQVWKLAVAFGRLAVAFG